MNTVVLATTAADADAVEAVEQHHAELAGALHARVEAVLTAASRPSANVAAARADLVDWSRRELLPHARAEEETLYPAAGELSEGRLLVTAMTDEHRLITETVAAVETAPDAVRAAAAAHTLDTLFASHLRKENEQILPLLAAARDVSLAAMLEGMHEILGGDSQDHGGHGHSHAAHAHDDGAATHAGNSGHTCGCGETEDDGYPELDARIVPHAIRHATIFGALDAVRPDGGLVLVAPHDPLPLLAQIEQREPGAFAVDYLERGPEAWRLQFVRRSA